MGAKLISRPSQTVAWWVAAIPLAWLIGCEAPFARIDRQTIELLGDSNERLGADSIDPRLDWEPGSKPDKYAGENLYAYDPGTENPPADALTYPVPLGARRRAPLSTGPAGPRRDRDFGQPAARGGRDRADQAHGQGPGRAAALRPRGRRKRFQGPPDHLLSRKYERPLV